MDAQQVAAVHQHGGVDGRRVAHEADRRQRPCTQDEQRVDGGQRQGRVGDGVPDLGLDAFDEEVEDAAGVRRSPGGGDHNDPEEHGAGIVDGIGVPDAHDGEVGMEVLKVLFKVKVNVLAGKDARLERPWLRRTGRAGGGGRGDLARGQARDGRGVLGGP